MALTETTGRSPPAVLRKPNERHVTWLLRRIWDRLNRRNQHFMFCIVGEEGSGKSWTAMKVAETVDPTFNADRVLFDIVDLLRILNDGEHDPGNFYVLDEAGVQLGRRTWQDRSQVLANQALQILRDENLGLIFTVPALGDLDSQVIRRLQAFYEVTDKVPDEHVEGKFKVMDPDRTDETGKVYKKYPKRRINGRGAKIKRFAFSPPSAELIAPYEQAKSAFQDQHYEATIQKFEEARGEVAPDDDADEDPSPKDVVGELREGDRVDDVVSYHGNTGEPYIDADLLEIEFDLSQGDARKVKKLARKDDAIDVE